MSAKPWTLAASSSGQPGGVVVGLVTYLAYVNIYGSDVYEPK